MNTKPCSSRSWVSISMSSVLATSMLILLAGCPVVPGDGAGGGDGGGDGMKEKAFVGAATCQACHADKHTNWLATRHADAFETLRAIGQHENAVCVQCHTVGVGLTDGFVDELITPELEGVQCENCHGPAGEHARNPSDLTLRPVVNLAATVCGACHTDVHHPTFDEWQLSKHSTALAGLLTNNFANDECLMCHSEDYRFAIEAQTEGKDVVVPTLNTAQLSIECATCHDPHGGVAQDHQLKMPIVQLCGECHTQGEEALPGNTPHHPQVEMATGVGAFDANDATLTVGFSPHASLFSETGQACAQCHVVRHDVEEPNEGMPVVTGHTFNPFDEEITTLSPGHQAAKFTGCLICHSADEAQQRFTDIKAEIEGRLTALAPIFDSSSSTYIDSTTLSDTDQARLATAKFNFQFVGADGSGGVHNATYARAALDTSESIVNSLTQP